MSRYLYARTARHRHSPNLQIPTSIGLQVDEVSINRPTGNAVIFSLGRNAARSASGDVGYVNIRCIDRSIIESNKTPIRRPSWCACFPFTKGCQLGEMCPVAIADPDFGGSRAIRIERYLFPIRGILYVLVSLR